MEPPLHQAEPGRAAGGAAPAHGGGAVAPVTGRWLHSHPSSWARAASALSSQEPLNAHGLPPPAAHAVWKAPGCEGLRPHQGRHL